MEGAHRTVTYDRVRGKAVVRLSEVIVVEIDSVNCISVSISERMPRRGFSAKVRVVVNAASKQSCRISIFGEIIPVGKDLSNQGAVHRAYLLLVEELKLRYNMSNTGFLGTLVSIILSFPRNNVSPQSLADSNIVTSPPKNKSPGTSQNRHDQSDDYSSRPKKLGHDKANHLTDNIKSAKSSPKEVKVPNMFTVDSQDSNDNITFGSHQWANKKDFQEWGSNDFTDMPMDRDFKKVPQVSQNITIDVKPLPKIRLDLMPSPREEDEDNMSASVSENIARRNRRM